MENAIRKENFQANRIAHFILANDLITHSLFFSLFGISVYGQNGYLYLLYLVNLVDIWQGVN